MPQANVFTIVELDGVHVGMRVGLNFQPDGHFNLDEDPSSPYHPYAAGDVFVIERAGNQMRYFQNGVVVEERTLDGVRAAMATAALQVEAFIGGVGSISDFTYSGVPQDVLWRDLVSTAVSFDPRERGKGSRLSKTVPAAGEVTNAASRQLLEGDGFFEFRSSQTDQNLTVGLSYLDQGTSSRFPFAFQLAPSRGRVLENGVPASEWFPYTAGTFFRIERKGGTLFLSAGSFSYTSPTPSTEPLFADTSFQGTAPTGLNSAVIYHADPVAAP